MFNDILLPLTPDIAHVGGCLDVKEKYFRHYSGTVNRRTSSVPSHQLPSSDNRSGCIEIRSIVTFSERSPSLYVNVCPDSIRLRRVSKTCLVLNATGAPLFLDVNTCRRKTIGKMISSTRLGVAMQVVSQSSTIGASVVALERPRVITNSYETDAVSYTHLTLPTNREV